LKISFKVKYSFTVLLIFFTTQLFSQQFYWKQLYSPVASSTTGITQLSNGELYLATKTLGIYKSTDNGKSWTESYTGFSNIYLNDIYFTDDNEIFACGGSGIFQFDWQTQDWINLNAPQADYFSIVVNSLGDIIAGSNFGIFRSEDGGNTWQAATTTNMGTVYSLAFTENNVLFAGTGSRIYKSTDNGDTWTQSGLYGFRISDLTLDNTGDIYANVFYRGQGIYRSKDQGVTWEQINAGITDQLTTAVEVNLKGDIYVGSFEGGVFLKTSGQPSFNQINLHQSMSQVLSIYIAQDNTLYICSELGGLFKRNESGTEWDQVNSGLPMDHAIPLGFDSDNNFYFGNFYSGVYRSTDTGENWFPIAPYLGGSHRFTFLANNDQLFLGTTIEIAFVGVLFKSTDKGEIWEFFMEGIPSIDPNWPYIQVVMDMDVNSSGDLFAALNTDGIYRRLVSDTSWYYINGDIPDTNIFSLCVNSNDVVFAGYRNGYIYKSDDNGEKWVESLSGVQDYTVELLKSEGEYVFAILHNWNYPYQDSSLGRYSYDNGSTWLNLNVSGLGSRVNSIGSYNDVIVVGTDTSGVFLSSNFGNNWISVNKGLSDSHIKGIVLHPDGYLLCGTEHKGIFIANLNPTNVDDINKTSLMFSLNQNYPNPFNPNTTISWQLAEGSDITLKVYDILGREVTTLASEYKPAGKYETELNATSLSSGVYFYQLKAGDFVDTKKLLLLK
jgi:photosystem II stability/assembly factor-like uncharacterized protein